MAPPDLMQPHSLEERPTLIASVAGWDRYRLHGESAIIVGLQTLRFIALISPVFFYSKPARVRYALNVGTLQIRRLSDGEKIGYLSQKYNRENAYTVHPRPGAALNVVAPPLAPFGVAIDLIGSNAPDSGHLFLGAVDDGQGNLGTGEAGGAMLSGTTGVRGNSPPSSNAGTSLTLTGHGGSESQIWTMNCQTRQITAQWTNTDGSQPHTTIFYDPAPKRRDSFLGLTGDLQAFNAAVSEDAYEVTITFIPNSE
ncbi:hypothetical protein C8R45DRAFT_1095207 [Mycena sanguinolenta]|nr:hypothetical protein C8R45DRAFT_1095207 [Mycena sanguinolenta]